MSRDYNAIAMPVVAGTIKKILPDNWEGTGVFQAVLSGAAYAAEAPALAAGNPDGMLFLFTVENYGEQSIFAVDMAAAQWAVIDKMATAMLVEEDVLNAARGQQFQLCKCLTKSGKFYLKMGSLAENRLSDQVLAEMAATAEAVAKPRRSLKDLKK